MRYTAIGYTLVMLKYTLLIKVFCYRRTC